MDVGNESGTRLLVNKEESYMLRTCWLHKLRSPEVTAYLSSGDVILVPVGATEQHGPHLPLSVDTDWAVAACEGAAELSGVVVAPPIHYGWSPHHMGYAGTVTLGADTLRQVVFDVCASLICHGFHHVVIVNGNRIANLQPLEIAAVQLQNKTGARVAVVDTGLIARTEIKSICEADDGGLEHAGEAETSFAMYRRFSDVDPAAVTSRTVNADSGEFTYPVVLDPSDNRNAVSLFETPSSYRESVGSFGYSGDPTLASPEKGKAMADAISMNLTKFLKEFATLEVAEVNAEVPT